MNDDDLMHKTANILLFILVAISWTAAIHFALRGE